MKLGEGFKALTGAPQDKVVPVNDAPRKRFPYLAGVASAISKLSHDIEEDARRLIERDIPAIDAKRQTVMAKARAKLTDHDAAIDELRDEIDKLDTMLGDNSGECLKE
jgi:hypothetical protein